MPQPPQFSGSAVTSKQTSPQAVWPAGQIVLATPSCLAQPANRSDSASAMAGADVEGFFTRGWRLARARSRWRVTRGDEIVAFGAGRSPRRRARSERAYR